jgi:hypothetical protein
MAKADRTEIQLSIVEDDRARYDFLRKKRSKSFRVLHMLSKWHPRQEQNVSLIRQCYKLAPGHEAKQWLRQRPALSYSFVSQSVYWPAGNKLPVEHQEEKRKWQCIDSFAVVSLTLTLTRFFTTRFKSFIYTNFY